MGARIYAMERVVYIVKLVYGMGTYEGYTLSHHAYASS